MMLKRSLGKIEGADLNRMQAICTRKKALEFNPRAYSASETESILLTYARYMQEVVEKFGIDTSEDFDWHTADGQVWYTGKDD